MEAAVRRLVRVFRAALAAGAVGLAMLASAVVVATLRFDACGASSLDAAERACRLGMHLLLGAYVVLGLALVLGAACLTLVWRLRGCRH